mmetsp:Transcript_173144/g.555234  ORF Transcript_173144/g.555234 Transcript_173144/m.555234 type:complete len:280 (+) Transcript_173144:861-1700(+)
MPILRRPPPARPAPRPWEGPRAARLASRLCSAIVWRRARPPGTTAASPRPWMLHASRCRPWKPPASPRLPWTPVVAFPRPPERRVASPRPLGMQVAFHLARRRASPGPHSPAPGASPSPSSTRAPARQPTTRTHPLLLRGVEPPRESWNPLGSERVRSACRAPARQRRRQRRRRNRCASSCRRRPARSGAGRPRARRCSRRRAPWWLPRTPSGREQACGWCRRPGPSTQCRHPRRPAPAMVSPSSPLWHPLPAPAPVPRSRPRPRGRLPAAPARAAAHL